MGSAAQMLAPPITRQLLEITKNVKIVRTSTDEEEYWIATIIIYRNSVRQAYQ